MPLRPLPLGSSRFIVNYQVRSILRLRSLGALNPLLVSHHIEDNG
ncbi:hypothetical protein GCM10025857_03150 [Alicyclobacillus contaminans]|nr:hypothetical protein GCM10025857_03150 [Alicyclobacillus contaminans]